jgi:endonuclease/exonuclease/phosphatase family metal-dependent hydrolase
LNTHLKWDPPETPRERQWGHKQVLQAVDILRSGASTSTGQIMCGDFNVTPASDVVATLLAAGLDYAHRGLAGICTCNSNGEPKLIDYLFCSDALRARPIFPAPIDGQTPLPSNDQPSDHLPLAAEFDWA